MTSGSPSRSTIDSLGRGIDLLEILATRDSVKLAELPELLDTSRATAFRLLKTLQDRGYVEHYPAESLYRLGPAAQLLADRSGSQSLVRAAQPALRDLAAETGETVNLALMRAAHLTYVEIVDGRHALRMSASPGQDVPMHSTALGKATLAVLPEERQLALVGPEPWTAYTPKTHTSWEALRPEIRRAAERGWAEDLEEMDEGAICVGAAILNREGEPVGGISVSGWAQRLDARTRREIGQSVAAWCRRITTEREPAPQAG